jgi:hypothetical protein
MSPIATKTDTKFGFAGLVEASYGAGGTIIPATHGIRVTDTPDVKRNYSYDGKRIARSPSTAAELPLSGTEGPNAEFTISQEGAGGGAAYSATVKPVNHLMLQLAQYTPTLSATAGTESYVYAPADEDNYVSGVLASWEGRERYDIYGALVDTLEIGAELTGGPILWKSSIKGLLPNEPIDEAIPVGLAYNATLPAKAVAMALSIGDFEPVRVKSFKYTDRLKLEARAWNNVAGIHGGFHPMFPREIRLDLTVEMPAMPASAPFHTATTFNPGELKRLATSLPIAFQVGATQYKRYAFSADNAQLLADPRERMGAVRMVALSFLLAPSLPTTNDQVAITFD